LADNKTAELATWDFSKLEDELSHIEMDMSVFGFEDLESKVQIMQPMMTLILAMNLLKHLIHKKMTSTYLGIIESCVGTQPLRIA